MPLEEPEKGDKVSWNWGNGQPDGIVAETKTEGDVAITSQNGNEIKKHGEPGNPAVHVERSGNDVVKKASELTVEEKANGDASKEDNEAKNGEKRKHNAVEDEEEKDEEKDEENDKAKLVRAKPNGNKKQKKEPPKVEKKKEQPKAEKKKVTKKADGAPAKPKKEPTPRATEGIGSRTRSRK